MVLGFTDLARDAPQLLASYWLAAGGQPAASQPGAKNQEPTDLHSTTSDCDPYHPAQGFRV